MNQYNPPYLKVKVTPRCKTEGVIGHLFDGTLKVGVFAVAENGKANESLIKVLAKHFHLKTNQVKIVSGHTSQIKLIKLLSDDDNE
jgi:uncharacterized protein (TIGR00251 family)